jgi:peptidoglycan/LPS O-acetylase OafA/YrhL
VFHIAVASLASKLAFFPLHPLSYRYGRVNDLLNTLILIGISLGVAMASWALVESRFLKLKRNFEYRSPPAPDESIAMVQFVHA